MTAVETKTGTAHGGRAITRLTPRGGALLFPDLWRWRYLVWLFVKRDFAIYYQQTVLGPLWYLLQLLGGTAVLSIVFGRIARLPTDGVRPFLFYMLGGVAWGFFADCFSRTSQALSANARDFGSAPFPRLTVPVAAVFSALIQFCLQFALFLAVYAWMMRGGMRVSVGILLFPATVVQLALTGLGGGLLVAALTCKYRDLAHLTGFCMQALYFCTPVVYPLSMVPRPLRQWYAFNPLAPAIESCRRAFFDTAGPGAAEYCIGWIVALVIVAAGVLVFTIVEKTFLDTV